MPAQRWASTRRCGAAKPFLKAGADMLFIESPESEAEMAKIGQTFAGVPLVANMVEGGRTPIFSARNWKPSGSS